MQVCEIFRSLQGECLTRGAPTTFIRFAGCNLHCSWCDTPYAQGKDGAQEMSISAILSRVRELGPPKLVCLTGGEPLLQLCADQGELIRQLLQVGTELISVETNGSRPIGWLMEQSWSDQVYVVMDYKLVSSGTGSSRIKDNLTKLRPQDVLKFVCTDRTDRDEALGLLREVLVRMHGFNPVIYFQPLGGQASKMLAQFVLEVGLMFGDRFDVRYGDQLHKLLWGNERGR